MGDIVHSNLYRPLPRVVRDDAGRYDLLFPGCRRETYDDFYRNGEGPPNCYDNINGHMERRRPIIRPLNLFMNTKVEADGKLMICPPVSKAGDCIALEALVSCISVLRRAAFPRERATVGAASPFVLWRKMKLYKIKPSRL